jgi:EAL and modified HD-GYP domain-containing signal transduction protein
MYYTYVARQPILNVNRVTVGYELLFRDGEFNAFPAHISSDRATYRLIVENFMVIGRNPNLDYSRCFVNFPHKSIINRLPFTLPKNLVVIEILETCAPSDELYEAIRELYRSGYQLALDDFVYSPKWERFIPYIHIIKIDVSVTGLDYACQFVVKKIKQGCKAKFLAECVETEEEFVRSREAGFEFFQGYFFRKPLVTKQKYVGPERIVAMQLLSEVCRDNVDFQRVEDLISTDVTLSYRLLSFVNSLSDRTSVEIKSFKQALIYLGEDRIKMFVSLAIASYISTKKPRELYYLSLQRARFCQLMAENAPFNGYQEQLFMVGLFSILDALMDVPLSELMEELPLSLAVKNAVALRQGELGDLLSLELCFEDADWTGLQRYCDCYGLTMKEVTKKLHLAQTWSRDVGHRS